MAYTALQNFLVVTYTDIRGDTRNRRIETDPTLVVTDPIVGLLDDVSKCALKRYSLGLNQADDALTPDADSEKADTARLYFDLDGLGKKGHFDIVDAHDDLFLATSGPNANIIKDYATLDAATAGTPEKALASIIDALLAGTFTISDGETPAAYLNGVRLV